MLTASGWFNVHEGKDKGQGDTAPYKRPKRPPDLFFAAGLLRWCRCPGCGCKASDGVADDHSIISWHDQGMGMSMT